jgi:cell division protein FtsB
LYYLAIIVALLSLIALFSNVVNQAFGAIATTFEIDPDTLAGEGRALDDLSSEELVAILDEHVANRFPVIVRDQRSQVPNEEYTESTLSEVIPNGEYPDGYADMTINEIRALDNTAEVLGEVLRLNMTRADLHTLVLEEVAKLQVVAAWKLSDSIFNWTPTAREEKRIAAIPDEINTLQNELEALQARVTDLQTQVTDLRSNNAQENAAAIRLQCSSFVLYYKEDSFWGASGFTELNYRTFLDRKVTKRDKKGTKQDEILPFWEEN